MNEKSLRALARAVHNDEFYDAMRRYGALFGEYRDRLPSIPYAYTRTQLLRMPHFEVVAMHWAPGSVSPVHDHGESRCWVVMLGGTLSVQNFERDATSGEKIVLRDMGALQLNAGDVDHRLGPSELHRVANDSKESAFSLQLYAAPIDTYTIVDVHSLTSRVVTATSDLVLQLD